MLDTRYNPQPIEEKWYAYWLENRFFASKPDHRKPYTIVIPPPNVTGELHMGHMLNNTIQDILIRRARMQGYNACWVPGTDHASIATEAKVVDMLSKQGIAKNQLSREQFLQYAWQWTNQYGGIILNQLRKLGCSCDWDRTRFTMEESLSRAVTHVFVDLYQRGKIYKANRIGHWDPIAKTVLSDQEVNYQEEQSTLYYINYAIEGSTDNEFITIATVRPETIMGDVAVCVHPDDTRYQHLHGKRCIVPLINRAIPIIADEYVLTDFGTGALKITPAHDANDFEIGLKYNLPIIDILTPDATLNEKAKIYIGYDRFAARKQIVKDLKEQGFLLKEEPYIHKIGYSERTKAIVEPKVTEQWYMQMDETARPALERVMDDTIRFFPERYKNLYAHWLENIRDWCISRQLWWGHSIPAYYLADGSCIVAETPEEALEQARQKTNNPQLSIADLRQDEDVLDTWFSSWLWPISVFDGFERRDELDYYYPTTVLVTGWDIIFFWVARMIMAGYEWEGNYPFKSVYFTGLVRDKQGRKMSKSLGNSPDPLGLIAQYSADGVRLGVLMSAPAGGDVLFDEKLCEQGRNFCNKIWNALRLIKTWEVDSNAKNTDNLPLIDWLEQKIQETLAYTESLYDEYRLSEVLKTLYSFIWDDFFSTYLELIKPVYQQPIDGYTYQKTLEFFEQIMQLLHPVMPFITEEVYQQLKPRAEGDSIMVSTYPTITDIDALALQKGETIKSLITAIRNMRNQMGMKQRDLIELYVKTSSPDIYADFIPLLTNKAFLSGFIYTDIEISGAISFLVGTDTFYIRAEDASVDTAKEMGRLQKELDNLESFKQLVTSKLQNEKFISSAPQQIIEREQQKLADANLKIQALQDSLALLQ